MELKWKKNLSDPEMSALADEALGQIENQKYDSELRQEGVSEILKLGIAFSGKKVIVRKKLHE